MAAARPACGGYPGVRAGRLHVLDVLGLPAQVRPAACRWIRRKACALNERTTVSTEARHWIDLVALWTPFKAAFAWCWGAGDATWLAVIKRIFLLLPLGAVFVGYWSSVLSIPTIIVRSRRRTFVSLMLVTWWDMARAMFAFWGGVFRFALQLFVSLLGAGQMLAIGVWTLVSELILLPFRFVRRMGSNVLNPGVPWIAVTMTFFWCVFEAIIFTFVTHVAGHRHALQRRRHAAHRDRHPHPAVPVHCCSSRSAATPCCRRSRRR
jgi:hypothetical protein